MATLNQLAAEVCAVYGKDKENEYLERAKDLIKHRRAFIVRQDVERNGASSEYRQHIAISLVNIDCNNIGCDETNLSNPYVKIAKRSSNTMPIPVTLKNPTPFLSFTDPLGNAIIFTQGNEGKFLQSLLPLGGLPYYRLINGYVYIWNYDKVKVLADYIFANPEDAINFCSSDCYNDDMDFPVGEHMIPIIVQMVIQDMFKVIQSSQTVSIDDTAANSINKK